MKRQLVLIAGPSASGKSTITRALRNGSCPHLGAVLGIDELLDWLFVHMDRLSDRAQPEAWRLVVHYDFLVQSLPDGGFAHLDVLLRAAESVRILTVHAPREVLVRRLESRIRQHAYSDADWLRRQNHHLSSCRQPGFVDALYARWFATIGRVGSHWIVDSRDPHLLAVPFVKGIAIASEGAESSASGYSAALSVDATIPFRDQALEAHERSRFGRAEALYRDALAENPDDIDALHMLGVVQFQRLRYVEALDCLWRAAEMSSWGRPQIKHNLGLVLARMLTGAANGVQSALLERFVAWDRRAHSPASRELPLVSVVIPAYNHERYVGQAIASVLAQSYRRIELIVIDDGSRDATRAQVRKAVGGASIPVRVVERDHRGAPVTLNEGARLARGDYVAFLNSDDYYAPDRIARMAAKIERSGAQWGFSLVTTVGDHGAVEAKGNGYDLDGIHRRMQLARLGIASNSFAFLTYNVAVSSGNLFVARDLFANLGGFRDYRYNHDWDFCLRACALAEPKVIAEPLYCYRLHDRNTIRESDAAAVEEAARMLAPLVEDGAGAPCTNPLAPQWPANRTLLLRNALQAGMGDFFPSSALRALADETRRRHPSRPASRTVRGSGGQPRGTAVVVLGCHRSGTSALTRLLNLCGAHLPDKLRPPALNNNAKGFWEAEDVIDLNERLLRSLGGAWHQVGFVLPQQGDVVDEFVHDVGAVFEADHGDRQLILVKDPRIAILAPFWHRALDAAGYRPVYIVPVRHPLEVARSLHARGDMSVHQGLALWRDYMTRIVAFADDGASALFIAFDDLFRDWRGVTRAIADHLALPLDIQRRADEVDAFLDPDLRRQHAAASGPDSLADMPGMDEVRDLYQACLARCVSLKAMQASPFRALDRGEGASPPG